MRKLILTIFLLSHFAEAARLQDINIMDIESKQNSFLLKLQPQGASNESFFFLEISQSDPRSYDKLSHIVKKILYKDEYKFDLNIPSFSEYPSGSYYRSEGVTFYRTLDREPNSTKAKKKK